MADPIRTNDAPQLRPGADTILPVCALCRVHSAAWTVGALAFCVTCEGLFGLDGCRARVGRTADGDEPAPRAAVQPDEETGRTHGSNFGP